MNRVSVDIDYHYGSCVSGVTLSLRKIFSSLDLQSSFTHLNCNCRPHIVVARSNRLSRRRDDQRDIDVAPELAVLAGGRDKETRDEVSKRAERRSRK